MAVELVMDYGFAGNVTTGADESALEDAASSGIRSMEKLIKLLSNQHRHQRKHERQMSEERGEMESDCMAVADAAVTKFRKVIALLDRTRTGHARFRRAPLVSSPLPQQPRPLEETKELDVDQKAEEPVRVYCPNPIQRLPPLPHYHHHKSRIVAPSPPVSAINSHATSAMTGETSSSFQTSASRPPLSTTTSGLKRKCGSKSEGGAAKCTAGGATGRCHCSKRRRQRVKRIVRVPAISLKMADIPSDDFSWRKYGQKPIKGSPHPRGYYKCSSVRGCPARKHVERAVDDPTMLVVTYEDDHNHTQSASEGAPPRLLLESSS